MKRALVTLFFGTLAALSVRADFLYWTVADADTYAKENNLTYSKAYLYATDGTTTKKIGTGGAGTKTWIHTDLATLTTKTAYWFYLELVNDSDDFVAQSASYTPYSALTKFIGTTATSMAWGGGTFTTVPEPTSALLMLLGFTALALKRKAV